MKKITLLLPCLFLLACSNQSSETNSSGFINNSGEIPSINLNDAEDYNPNKEEMVINLILMEIILLLS